MIEFEENYSHFDLGDHWFLSHKELGKITAVDREKLVLWFRIYTYEMNPDTLRIHATDTGGDRKYDFRPARFREIK